MKKIFLIMLSFVFQLVLQTVVLAQHYEINGSSTTVNQTFENFNETLNGGVFYVKDTGNLTISSAIFTNNKSLGSLGGGALFNNEGKINISNGVIFASNIAANGGAIYNTNTWNTETKIKGGKVIFSSNSAYENGGAIANMFSTMVIDGGEKSITFSYNTSDNGGGAIFNCDNSKMTIDCSDIVFNFNTAKGAAGGTICNFEKSEMAIKGENIIFSSNTANTGGGAIDNTASTMEIKGSSITFSSNSTGNAGGGAIFNYKMNDNQSIMTIIGSKVVFKDNTTTGSGGAIYNADSIINLLSTGSIEFTGNTANGISNAIHDDRGTINLYASENSEIVFNDRITSKNNTSILNINQSTTTLNTIGKIVLNEDMSGYTGQVNLYDGEIELKSKTEEGSNINTNKFFSGDINLSSGTLNIQNGAIDNITVNSLTTTANANLKFDVDLSNNTSDNFKITNAGTGEINLTAINILGIYESTGTITLFNNEVAPELNVLTTAYYGGYKYSFSTTAVNGELEYKQTGTKKTFKEVVNDTESEFRSYSLAEDEIVTEDLGKLGGTQLTIFGNGKNIEGNNADGISVGSGQTLNIENINNWNGFNGALRNEGTLNITRINFSNNIASNNSGGAIYNKGGKTIITDGAIFSSNTATGGGAIENKEGEITIAGRTIIFSSNSVNTTYGGAIDNCERSTMTISGDNMLFVFNKSYRSGGAIANSKDSIMTISGEDIIFSSNETYGYGGAINNHERSTMTISGDNILFKSNISTYFGYGGAIYNYDSSLIITGEKIEFNSNIAEYFGGAIANNFGGSITISGDSVNFSSNTAGTAGGAIYNSGSILNLVSTEKMEFTGNTANGISNAIHDSSGTINLYASENAKIIFNDRITSENSNSVLNINQSTTTLNAIGKIVLNEDMRGYTGQVNLYAGTVQIGQYGTWFGGDTYVDKATIDMANSILQEHNFNILRVTNNLNLFVDADLAKKQMDTITANDYSGDGKVNIKAINILEDATEDRTEILFTSSTVLKDKITSIKTASSALYKYDVNYNSNTGDFEFSLTTKSNPVIVESQVATAVGGILTQTAVLNQAFASIDSAIQDRYISYYEASNRKNMKKTDLYASTSDLLYTEDTNKIERGLWIRPYAIQDTIDINNMSVDNTAMGTLAGLDLSVGENSLLSFYIGYAGSTQKYEDIKVNQTGYVVGATGMIIKDDYYLGLTANINFNKAESENDYGTDKFDMNMYAVGAKAGYNVELGKKWILEPSLSLMYGNINTQEYKTKQGAQIASQSTSNILIEPQVKAKLDLTKGWTPYALVGYILNAGNNTKLVVNNIAFDDMQIKGYAEYGIGVNKSFKNSSWSCFLQATGKGGDRKGFEGNIGIRYSL